MDCANCSYAVISDGGFIVSCGRSQEICPFEWEQEMYRQIWGKGKEEE